MTLLKEVLTSDSLSNIFDKMLVCYLKMLQFVSLSNHQYCLSVCMVSNHWVLSTVQFVYTMLSLAQCHNVPKE